MATSTEMQTATDKAVTNLDRLNRFVNGDATTDVTLDSGSVPSISKAVSVYGDASASAFAALGYKNAAAASATAASGSATSAQGYANSALASLNTAEALVGATYTTVSSGLAATAEGNYFAVDPGTGIVSIYKKVSGSASLIRIMATTSALAGTGAGQGSALVGYRAPITGAVDRTIKDKCDETISIKDTGANGTDNTSDTAAIQAAIDAANAKFISSGSIVGVYVPDGDFVSSASINMKSGVRLYGPGRIRRINNNAPTGSSFALIVCNGISDFDIQDVSFEAVDRATQLSVSMSSSADIGSGNTCIDVRGCTRFSIENCRFSKYQCAIIHQGNSRYRIANNTFTANNGKTVQQMIDGTFTEFSQYTFSGAIMVGYTSSGIPATNTDYLIYGNIIDNAGLDIGIEGFEQTYDQAPGIIINNVIRGGNAGIQTYRGSFTDPGTATTFNNNILIANNLIQYTWQQGIYHRSVVGGTVVGNRLYRTGMGGSDGTTSAAALLFRVNMFPANATSASVVAGRVSNDHPVVCHSNTVVDHGTLTGSSEAFLQIEFDNVQAFNNVLTRTAEFATVNGTATATKVGRAVQIGNGKLVERGVLRANRISGTFTAMVYVNDGIGKNIKNCMLDISENQFTGACDVVIDTDWYGVGLTVHRNVANVTCATAALRLLRAPYSTISDNIFRGTYALYGFVDNGANLACDYAYLLSKGVVAAGAYRRGSTVRWRNNQISGLATPANGFVAQNTSGTDTTFLSRTAECVGNTVNGNPLELVYAGGTPPSSGSVRTWHRSDFVKNSTMAAGAAVGKYCRAAGTYGDATTTTGDTTSGSPVITNVANMNSYGPGIYIQPTGFSAPAFIIDIDTTANTITVDANAASTNTGVALTIATPTFGTAETGWTADTGTAKKTANTTYTAGTTLTFSATYTQAEHTALATRLASTEAALQSATQTIKAMKDTMIAAGIIGV